MKKFYLLCIGILSISSVYAQEITDALRYSQSEIQGTARFRALSGAFGALGGDMSAVSLNPAGSAVFSRSNFSITGIIENSENDTRYFNGFGNTSETEFNINQGGAAFVFASRGNSPWRKFALGFSYERTNNYDDNWYVVGTNTNDDGNFSNSIASYFYDYADGKRLDEISALPEESLSDAYREIGFTFGFPHQQAFLGFESYILEPDADDDANTTYTSNIAPGTFNHDYTYAATGYNGKFTFNASTQYQDNLYLGLNLNSHYINYRRSNLLFEDNANMGSIVNDVEFQNNLLTRGNGFSFQVGAIVKLGSAVRLGAVYDSPTWYTIEEETTQFLQTFRNEGGTNVPQTIDPNVVNIYPRYRLQTPSKITGSIAYVFGKSGLISFDYSNKNYANTELKPTSDPFFRDQNNIMQNVLTSASTYRFGGEYKIKQLSLRGGYRFEESPYKDGITIGDLEGFSAGIGYSFGNTKFDITYDQSNQSFSTPLYSIGLVERANIDRKLSNVLFTLSFNI